MRTPAGVPPSENAGMNNRKHRRHGRLDEKRIIFKPLFKTA
jgi:hypothetical protein